MTLSYKPIHLILFKSRYLPNEFVSTYVHSLGFKFGNFGTFDLVN